MFVGTLTDNLQCRLSQPIDFGCGQSHRTSTFHGGHHCIEYTAHNKDFLFGDAEQIVIVSSSLNNASGGQVEVGCFVDDHWRITWARDHCSLATVQCSSSDCWSPRNADESNIAVLEKLLRRFQRWLAYKTNEIVNSKVRMDRLIESTNSFRSDSFTAWVWIDDERIAAGDHANCVSSDGRQRMGDRRDDTDHSKRCVFDDG